MVADERFAPGTVYLVQATNLGTARPRVAAEIRDIHAAIGPPAIPYACRVCDRPVTSSFEFGALCPDILCADCRDWAEAYHLGVKPAWMRYWRRVFFVRGYGGPW